MAGPKPSESAPAVQVDGSFVLEASTTTLHLRLTLLSLTVLPYLLYFFLFIPIHSPRPQKRTASFRLATLRELSPYGYNPSNLSESGNELSAHFTIKGARHSGGSSRATGGEFPRLELDWSASATAHSTKRRLRLRTSQGACFVGTSRALDGAT
jgi:hypothetical protein